MERCSTSTLRCFLEEYEEGPQHKMVSEQATRTENQAERSKTHHSLPEVEQQYSLMSEEESMVLILTEAISGSSRQRIDALGRIDDGCVQGSISLQLFDSIVAWLMRPNLKDQQVNFLMKVAHRLLHNADGGGENVQLLVPKIVTAVQPFLLDDNSLHCMKAREIIYDLSKIAGSMP